MVTDLVNIFFIMNFVPLAHRVPLPILRMDDDAVNANNNRLVHCIGDDLAVEHMTDGFCCDVGHTIL